MSWRVEVSFTWRLLKLCNVLVPIYSTAYARNFIVQIYNIMDYNNFFIKKVYKKFANVQDLRTQKSGCSKIVPYIYNILNAHNEKNVTVDFTIASTI
jgi:hypothetical protein